MQRYPVTRQTFLKVMKKMTHLSPKSVLILITASYPYGAVAESSLDKEIPFLSSAFDVVRIVPRSYPVENGRENERIERNLPENIFIDNSLILSRENKVKRILYIVLLILTSRHLYSEILKNKWIMFNITGLKRIVGCLLDAFQVYKWAEKYLQECEDNIRKTIFYTYWLDGATMGLGLLKKRYPRIKLISRAHGGDLYEERYKPPYLPFRYEILSSLNRLFLISKHGYSYLVKKYPLFQDNYEISRLGVRSPGFITKPSNDGVFRIVSCSYIVPVKRIGLLIQGLKVLGQEHPEESFQWVHIGYGPLMKQMEEFAINCLSNNVIFNFLGLLKNQDVISYYHNNPVDIFINVSSSEGIPVSIMEAQSCGIPVVATAVGGTPEIVNNDVGILLEKDPTPQEIANAIWSLKNDTTRFRQLKENNYMNWYRFYNAEKNFEEFIMKIKSISG